MALPEPVDARSRGTTVPVVLGKTGDVVLHEKKFDLSPIAFPWVRPFPNQETDLRAEDTVCEKGEKIGEIVIDIAARSIDIKKTKKAAEIHPTSIFKDNSPRQMQLANALCRYVQMAKTADLAP